MQKRKSVYSLILLAAAALMALTGGSLLSFHAAPANAEAEQDYYYAQLSNDAKRFYDAIADMDEQGMLKQGDAKYDLISSNVLTEVQLRSYGQNSSVMAAFGAARDAYYLDHPEVFYIDFSYLSVSVGTKNGEYVATLGTGRADTYYIDGGFSSKEEIDEATTAYNTAIDEIVTAAKSQEGAADKVRTANASLVEKIDYTFCAASEEAACAPHIRTSYGALVNGKAVCEGFARAFKCVMDQLEIPCVIVHGYASYEGGLEPHAWNCVKIDNSWYGVDVTWNNSTGKTESYLLLGKTAMEKEHIEDGVISAASFDSRYPLLTPDDYGVGSQEISVVYDENGYYKVSYDGKNCTELEAEGLYLSYRVYRIDDEGYSWSNWATLKSVLIYTQNEDCDGYSIAPANPNTKYLQFSIITYAPDLSQFGHYTGYNEENLSASAMRYTTKYYEHADFGIDKTAPYVKSTTPDCNGTNLDATKTYDIQITYTKALKKVDPSKPVEIKTATYDPDTIKYIEISDVNWDENVPDTLTFRFTPSAMYQHRDEAYTFTPQNLVSADNDLIPMSATYLTRNNNVACNRVYSDGRLYVNTYGRPSLVGSGDLSMNGWKDENGNLVSENQRSQLMLVASKTTEREGSEMLQNIDIPDGAVKSSETFEIEMNLCKNIVKIPDGSTVQLAFGFPEGYGPDDAGVTFKVYHFHRGENGKIDYSLTEEIECVVTEYGIIVNVSDFSPFAVVAVDKTQVENTKKSVFARSVGFGGSFEGKIAQLVGEGESATFTVTPDEGYRIAKVTLNGETLTVDGNTVTLNYAQLSDRNTVEIHYVADSVAEYEETEGIDVIYPCVDIAATDSGTVTPPAGETGGDGLPDFAVALIIVAAALVGAAVVGAIVIVTKKNKAK